MVGGEIPSLRIVFFGTPLFAVATLNALLASRHPVAAVVTQPDRPRGRGQRMAEPPVKQVARAHHLPVLQPAKLNREFVEQLAGFELDLGVVAAYGKILPTPVLSTPRLGMINVHASLLPRYRGAAPVQRAILAGENESGVTIMRIVPELDAGPVLAAASCAIAPDATSADVERELARIGARLLVRTVEDIAAERAREIPQRDADATYAPKIAKSEEVIDWSATAEAIHNKVRALHAFTSLHGTRVIILRTAIDSNPAPARASPGELVSFGADDLRVVTGDGRAVKILQLQLEGRRDQTAREFLSGHPIAPGSRFGS
jgi:methionyl-tRNA formyltransferase